MSLKSFDKFCETMITGEPASRKIIYDERQKQIASKLNVEALLIFAIAAALNTIVMDEIYQWCDTFFAPMIFTAALCYDYWVLRRCFSGVMFGINGVKSAKWTAFVMMAETICFSLMYIDDLSEEGGVFRNGMISTTAVCGISFAIVFIGWLVTFIFAKKTEKAEDKSADAEYTCEGAQKKQK